MRASFRHTSTLILILCLLLGFGTIAHAQQPDSIPNATKSIVVRPFDAEKVEKLRTQEDFQYYEAIPEGESLWERLKRRFQNWLREALYEGRASGLWEALLYIAIAGAIVFIVIKMQKVDNGSLFGRRADSMATPYDVFEENIHEMDMKALIAEAVGERNYRKAVRLHYLQSLKFLTNGGLIEWKPGKTNRSYIHEIPNQQVRREFEQLTGMFEYVWYGGAALSDELYTSAREEFTQFDYLVQQRA